jgi:hypothetical protein
VFRHNVNPEQDHNMAKKKERVAKVAKAGRRSAPANKGPHTTTIEDRKRGRWLSRFGLKLYRNPFGGTSNA